MNEIETIMCLRCINQEDSMIFWAIEADMQYCNIQLNKNKILSGV